MISLNSWEPQNAIKVLYSKCVEEVYSWMIDKFNKLCNAISTVGEIAFRISLLMLGTK